MGALIDLTHQHFGELTVLCRVADVRVGTPRWRCRCSCGKETVVDGASLRAGHTKSCCCKRDKRTQLPRGIAAFNRVVETYRNNAKVRSIAFDLTESQCRELFDSKCHYCGIPPATTHASETKSGISSGDFIYNGIDRVNNDLGYCVSNCVPCCRICNRAKNSMPLLEFQNWVQRLVSHRFWESSGDVK